MRKVIKINGKEVVLKVREPFAPKTKIKQSKKKYNRKEKNKEAIQ